MLQCVGQGAIGIEIRASDERLANNLRTTESLHTTPVRHQPLNAPFLCRHGRRLSSPNIAAYAEEIVVTATAGAYPSQTDQSEVPKPRVHAGSHRTRPATRPPIEG